VRQGEKKGGSQEEKREKGPGLLLQPQENRLLLPGDQRESVGRRKPGKGLLNQKSPGRYREEINAFILHVERARGEVPMPEIRHLGRRRHSGRKRKRGGGGQKKTPGTCASTSENQGKRKVACACEVQKKSYPTRRKKDHPPIP